MSNATPEKPTVPLTRGMVEKLLGQEMNTIMLFMILGAFGYAFWWAMTVGVPAHLKQIQDGYERIVSEHSKEIEKTQAHFDKTLDRIERASKDHSVEAARVGE